MKTLTFLFVAALFFASCSKNETADTTDLKRSVIADSLDVYCNITNDTQDTLILTTGYTSIYLFDSKFKGEVHFYAKIECGKEYIFSVKSTKNAPIKLKMSFNNDNAKRVALVGNYSNYKTYFTIESAVNTEVKGVFSTSNPYFTRQ